MPAADIDDAAASGEIIGLGHFGIAALAESDHGALEEGGLLRVLRQPLETRRAEHMLEGGLSRAQGMEQMSPRRVGLAVQHPDEVAWARGRVGPERVAQPGLREAARLLLAKDAFAREEP